MQIAVLFMAAALQAASPLPPPAATPPAALSGGVDYHGRFASGDEHVPAPYELVNKYPVFRVEVAGRQVWALLDTGASGSIVDTGLAKAAGLRVESTPDQITLATGGTLPKQRVPSLSFSIDKQLDITGQSVAAMDMSNISAIVGRKIEFILGADVISLSTLKLDPGAKTLDIYPSGAFHPPPNFPFVPLKYDKTFQIEILVGDKPVSVYIDTGSPRPLHLDPKTWERVAPPGAKLETTAVIEADGQAHKIDYGILPLVRIGPIRATDVKAGVDFHATNGPEGVVGMPVMNMATSVIDAKSGKLWFLPPARPAPAPTSGAP